MNDVNGKHRSTLTSMLLGRHKGHPFSATTRSARDSQVTLFQAKMCAVCGFCFEGCIHKKTTSALAACVVNVSKRPCRQLWARVARRAWYIFFTLKCALTGVRALSLKVGEKLEQVGTEAGLPVFPSPDSSGAGPTSGLGVVPDQCKPKPKPRQSSWRSSDLRALQGELR
jgi:hypothetical protein